MARQETVTPDATLGALDRLRGMAVFHEVVTARSFTGAARRLGLSVAAVSRQVTKLEAELQVRLLQRTTRRLALTEAGERYASSCAKVVEEARGADEAVASLQQEPRGLLRIGSAHAFAVTTLVPSLRRFVEKHPGVTIDLVADDRVTDLLAERLDLSIRGGQIRDSGLRARKLMDAATVLAASPDYLRRAGTPKTIEELQQHQWVALTVLGDPGVLRILEPSGRERRVKVRPHHRTSSILAMHAMVEQGFGIGATVAAEVEPLLRRGTLVRVLPKIALPVTSLSAVFPSRDYLPLHVRSCVEHLVEDLKLHARWDKVK